MVLPFRNDRVSFLNVGDSMEGIFDDNQRKRLFCHVVA
jgi:hypothetical protein